MRPAVFIDRDGTINKQRGYLNHLSRFTLLQGAGRAISLLNESNRIVVVTSNQSGVARGYFPLDLVEKIHEVMRGELAKDGAHVDEIYFCPHHPNGSVPDYSKECRCRKPDTGLIEKARSALDIDMKRSFVIGDRWNDIQFASNAGLPGILVLTGYGRGDLQYIVPGKKIKPSFVADNLMEAALWIVSQDKLFEK